MKLRSIEVYFGDRHGRIERNSVFRFRSDVRAIFGVDERLPILCGANPYVEADLLDAAHKLAVMLDVSSELSDLDAYRRARREDWLLQRNGYRVVRLLAEDVCARLDETLAFIECGIR